jgi:hypothetical protein
MLHMTVVHHSHAGVARMTEEETVPRQPTLTELPESQATGTIAEIYEEIRVYCGVPYVSSMQRHLATRPGALEWVWMAVRPAVVDGTIAEMAWQCAGEVQVRPLPPLTRPALRLLGVDEAGEAMIRTICATFIRVSPINLLFGGIVRRLLEGEQPGGSPNVPHTSWTPSPLLPAGPSMLHAAELPPDHRAVLRQYETDIGTSVFVPGLYRMLAHWPGYLSNQTEVLHHLLRSTVLWQASEPATQGAKIYVQVLSPYRDPAGHTLYGSGDPTGL